MVIGQSGVQFGLYSYERLAKSDDREAGVRFVNHECDYRRNWTTRSPVINLIMAVKISKNNKHIEDKYLR